MLSKTKIALSTAIVLSVVLPASAATKHHSGTHVHRPIYNLVHRPIYNMVVPAAVGGGCTASGGPECSSACTGSGPCAPPDSW
jgi:hypothetical protein